ncbi:CPBP family intramembrane glutamic endopeptidase [Blastococcus sp. SYSU DS0533]
MTGTLAPAARSARDQRGLGLFLVLVFVVTWAVWVPRALESAGVLGSRWATELGTAWTYGPAVAAVLAAACTGRVELRELGARVLRWRVGARWWAVVLAGPALLWLLAAGLHAGLGGAWDEVRPPAVEAGLPGLVPLLLLLALTDGLGEELGWRGWALPRLLRLRAPLAASLLLGLVWAVWHAPLHWTDGSALGGTATWLLLVQLPAAAVVWTWVFLQTGGALLPAIVLHASLSAFGTPLPGAAGGWGPWFLFAGLLAAVAATLVATGGLRPHLRTPSLPR